MEMSILTSFSLFEDPDFLADLASSTTALDPDPIANNEMTESMAAGSPDSGIFSYDMDDPFLTDVDPVLMQADIGLFAPPAMVSGYNEPDDQSDLQFLIEEDEIEESEVEEDPCTSVVRVDDDDQCTTYQGEEDLIVSPVNVDIDVFEDEDNVDHEVEGEGDDDDTPELSDCVSPTNITTTSTRQPNFQIHSYSSRSGGRARRRVPLLPNSATALTRPSKSRPRISRKRKLYELDAPLDNPAAEKCRLNAINAKKNRERKKQELAVAEDTIAALRNENEALREEAESARDELDEARQEIEAMRAQLKQAGLPVLGKRLRLH